MTSAWRNVSLPNGPDYRRVIVGVVVGMVVGITTGIGLNDGVMWALLAIGIVCAALTGLLFLRRSHVIAFDASFVAMALCICFMILRHWYWQLVVGGVAFIVALVGGIMVAMVIGVRRTLKQDERLIQSTEQHR